MRLLSLSAAPFAASYENNSALRGQPATNKRVFGDCSCYAVAPVHTRFDAVQWFVWDAETNCPLTGRPEVIRQAETLEAALAGLV